MKFEVAIFLILAAAVSAQLHYGGVGHLGGGYGGIGHSTVGHLSGGHGLPGHHSRFGRSLVVAPVGYGHVGELILMLLLRIFPKTHAQFLLLLLR